MKIITILFTLGFVWQTSHANHISKITRTCLIENRFTYDISELSRIEAIGHPRKAHRLKEISNKKLAAVFACLFHKLYPGQNLSDSIKRLIQQNDKVSKAGRKRMLKTLSKCKRHAAGDDAKLLNCVKVTTSPFDNIMVTIRNTPDVGRSCYQKCGMKSGEMYKMLMEIVGNNKVGCLAKCFINEVARKSKQSKLLKFFANYITTSKNHYENQKKIFLAKLKKCKKEVDAAKGRNRNIFECLKIFRSQFLKFGH